MTRQHHAGQTRVMTLMSHNNVEAIVPGSVDLKVVRADEHGVTIERGRTVPKVRVEPGVARGPGVPVAGCRRPQVLPAIRQDTGTKRLGTTWQKAFL